MRWNKPTGGREKSTGAGGISQAGLGGATLPRDPLVGFGHIPRNPRWHRATGQVSVAPSQALSVRVGFGAVPLGKGGRPRRGERYPISRLPIVHSTRHAGTAVRWRRKNQP